MKSKILLLALSVIAIFSCKQEKKEIISDKEYTKFIYELPESKYVYDVKINEISTEIVKNAFTIKEDKYSVGTKKNGYRLTISISITNPYDKEMNNIPFPENNYIASTKKEDFTEDFSYEKRFGDIIKPKITDEKNNKIESIVNSDCLGYNLCLNFKPKETKNFKLNFESPILSNVKILTLVGYRLNIEYEKDELFLDKTGIIIDVDKKKVIGEQKF